MHVLRRHKHGPFNFIQPWSFSDMLHTGSYELRFLSSSSVPCVIHIDLYFFSQPAIYSLQTILFGDFLTFFISANQQSLNKTFKAPLKKLSMRLARA